MQHVYQLHTSIGYDPKSHKNAINLLFQVLFVIQKLCLFRVIGKCACVVSHAYCMQYTSTISEVNKSSVQDRAGHLASVLTLVLRLISPITGEVITTYLGDQI
jgi:hypothetical protein